MPLHVPLLTAINEYLLKPVVSLLILIPYLLHSLLFPPRPRRRFQMSSVSINSEDESRRSSDGANNSTSGSDRQDKCHDANLSSADTLRIFFLLSRVLNSDLALVVLERADFDKCDADVFFKDPFTVSNHRVGRPIVRTRPIRVARGGAAHAIRRIRLEAVAHDQGWSSDPQSGSWTWFTLCLLSPVPAPTPTEARGVRRSGNAAAHTIVRHSLEFARNNMGDAQWQKHGAVLTADDEDEERAALVASIRNGDVLEIRACAIYPAWRNFVQSASIEIDTSIL